MAVKKLKDGRVIRKTVRELCVASKIPRRTLCLLSAQSSWNRVKLEMIDAFSRACAVDLLDEDAVASFVAEHGASLSFLTKLQLRKMNELAGKYRQQRT
jgi:hypothetical protein